MGEGGSVCTNCHWGLCVGSLLPVCYSWVLLWGQKWVGGPGVRVHIQSLSSSSSSLSSMPSLSSCSSSSSSVSGMSHWGWLSSMALASWTSSWGQRFWRYTTQFWITWPVRRLHRACNMLHTLTVTFSGLIWSSPRYESDRRMTEYW